MPTSVIENMHTYISGVRYYFLHWFGPLFKMMDSNPHKTIANLTTPPPKKKFNAHISAKILSILNGDISFE